jgi:hypothetical protein
MLYSVVADSQPMYPTASVMTVRGTDYDPMKEIDEEAERLKHQMMALHTRKRKLIFDGVEINSKARGGPPGDQQTTPTTNPPVAAVQPQQQQPIVLPAHPGKPAPSTHSTPPTIKAPTNIDTDATVAQPTHPFSAAKDANYLPPKERNFGTAPSAKGRDAAYHTTAPIQSPRVADDVYKRTMDNQSVILSYAELFSLSPEMRNRFKDAITPRKVSNIKTNLLYVGAEEPLPFPTSAMIGDNSGGVLDGIMMADPYEVYVNLFGQETPVIKVAKDAHNLRSMSTIIDHKEEVECILDGGSMIVAMSEACCNGLGLSYDPTIHLRMESANGEIDLSLGLARNVPVTIGPITLYLQLHVIKSPAYDILLGRPFDVLTESTIKNYRNEDVVITIEDPNSDLVVSIPTLRRGPPRFSPNNSKPSEKTRQGFQTRRN